MSWNIRRCVLGCISCRPTRTCRFYSRSCLLLNVSLTLDLWSSNSWILVHRWISTVCCLLTHRLNGLFEIFRVHLTAGMSLLNIIKFLLQGRADLNHFIYLTINASFFKYSSVCAANVEILRGGLHLEGCEQGLICETLGCRTPSIFARRISLLMMWLLLFRK